MRALLLLLVLSGASEFDMLSAQLHLETGNAFLQQGLLEQAEQEFRLALDAGVDCHEALLGLGKIYRACSSADRASEYFTEFITASPDDYRGYYEMASMMLETGRADSAVFMADSAFLRAPTNPDIWLLSGRAAIASGDTTGAERWYTRCLSDPGSAGLQSLILLGTLYRATDRSVESRELLLPASRAGYAPACWGLAMVYLSWNDYMRTVDSIQRYLALDPEGVYADSAIMVLESLAESGEYIVPDWN